MFEKDKIAYGEKKYVLIDSSKTVSREIVSEQSFEKLESNTEEGEEQDDYDTKDVKIEQDEEDEDDIDLKSDPMARSKALEEFLSESPKVKRMIEMFEEAQKRSIDDETDTVEEAQKRSIDDETDTVKEAQKRSIDDETDSKSGDKTGSFDETVTDGKSADKVGSFDETVTDGKSADKTGSFDREYITDNSFEGQSGLDQEQEVEMKSVERPEVVEIKSVERPEVVEINEVESVKRSPLVLESISPVARIVEDIESHVDKLERILSTEQNDIEDDEDWEILEKPELEEEEVIPDKLPSPQIDMAEIEVADDYNREDVMSACYTKVTTREVIVIEETIPHQHKIRIKSEGLEEVSATDIVEKQTIVIEKQQALTEIEDTEYEIDKIDTVTDLDHEKNIEEIKESELYIDNNQHDIGHEKVKQTTDDVGDEPYISSEDEASTEEIAGSNESEIESPPEFSHDEMEEVEPDKSGLVLKLRDFPDDRQMSEPITTQTEESIKQENLPEHEQVLTDSQDESVDQESTSSKDYEEYKIPKYEYDQEIKEKQSFKHQLYHDHEQLQSDQEDHELLTPKEESRMIESKEDVSLVDSKDESTFNESKSSDFVIVDSKDDFEGKEIKMLDSTDEMEDIKDEIIISLDSSEDVGIKLDHEEIYSDESSTPEPIAQTDFDKETFVESDSETKEFEKLEIKQESGDQIIVSDEIKIVYETEIEVKKYGEASATIVSSDTIEFEALEEQVEQEIKCQSEMKTERNIQQEMEQKLQSDSKSDSDTEQQLEIEKAEDIYECELREQITKESEIYGLGTRNKEESDKEVDYDKEEAVVTKSSVCDTTLYEAEQIHEIEKPEDIFEFKTREQILKPFDKTDDSEQIISIVEQEVIYVQDKNEIIDLYDQTNEDQIFETDITKQEMHTALHEKSLPLEMTSSIETEEVESVDKCPPHEVHDATNDNKADIPYDDTKSDEKETDAVTLHRSHDTVDDIKADSLLVTEEPIFEVGEIYAQDTSKHQIEEIIEIQPAEKVDQSKLEKSEEEQLFTLTQEETVFTESTKDISPQDEIDKTKLEKLEQDPLFTLTQEETVATEIAGEISPQDELVELQSPEEMDKTKLEKLEQEPLFTLTQEETVATEIAGEISPQDELVEIQSPEKIDQAKLDKYEENQLLTLAEEDTVLTDKTEDISPHDQIIMMEPDEEILEERHSIQQEEIIFTENKKELSSQDDVLVIESLDKTEHEISSETTQDDIVIIEEAKPSSGRVEHVDVPIIISEPVTVVEDLTHELSPEEREVHPPSEEIIEISPVVITIKTDEESQEIICQLHEDIDNQKIQEDTIKVPTRQVKDTDKELSSSSTMSDEDLVEKPKRISFSDETECGQVVIKDQTVFTLDDTDAEKCVQVEVPLKQILTDKDESLLKDTMAFSTLSSSADLQEEIVDIEEYDTGANRINQDLQREADEEMSGFPVDFVARKNSVEPDDVIEETVDSGAHVIDVIEPSEREDDLEMEIPSEYYSQPTKDVEMYTEAELCDIVRQSDRVDELRAMMSDDTIKMELEWEPPSKRVMSSEEVKLHTVEKKVAYDERHDIIEKKEQHKSGDVETCDVKTEKFHKTFSAEITTDTLIEDQTTTNTVLDDDKLYEIEETQQKVIKDDQAVAHFKTEKSETEFHAVQAKDSDIEIKEVENKEIFDETFEISVKKDTEITETEKKHDGESDQKVTDISETTVTKETKTVVDEKSTDKLEYKVDRTSEEITKIFDEIITDRSEYKMEEESTEKYRQVEKIDSQDDSETYIDRKEIKHEIDSDNKFNSEPDVTLNIRDKHVRFVSETAEISPCDSDDMSNFYIDRTERFLYLPEDTDPTKMFDLKSKRGDFMGDFPTDSSDKYDDDHYSAGFDDEQDQQRFGSSEGTHQVDRQESIEIDEFQFSRKLSSAEVDEFEHELRMEQNERDEIIQCETKHELEFEGTSTPQSVDGRPLSPSSYTLETDTDMEGSRSFEPDELMDDNFDVAQQIFIEQKIEAERTKTERPPSPSDFTLVTSQDQDALTKLLGLDDKMDKGDAVSEHESNDKVDKAVTEHEATEQLHDTGSSILF